MQDATTSTQEWLEADGLGGFASGTATGIRTRRYHALLLAAITPPTGRFVLVNGFDAWIETDKGRFPISSQYYAPDVLHPDGATRIEAFAAQPWPQWIFRLPDGTRIEQEIFVSKGEPLTLLRWNVLGPAKNLKLCVRPFLSGRDYHGLHKINSAFGFEADVCSDRVAWQPYEGVPGVVAVTNARYRHDPQWFHNFLYEEERSRGLDCQEDLAAPGVFEWDLGSQEAVLILTTKPHAQARFPTTAQPIELFETRRKAERKRRAQFASTLDAAADAYIVDGRRGKTIVAGYPWFTDWGRDTFIALRGLCLATGRLAEARDILLSWTDAVSEGMLPNRFPDAGQSPEFNSVDASLWFVIAVHDLFQAAKAKSFSLTASEKKRLEGAVSAILDGYAQGTRFNIRLDSSGLLSAGQFGMQLTWMDSKIGEWVVTPRIGKPVEIQALWLNALWIGSQMLGRWKNEFERGRETFRRRFWNHHSDRLYDVIDVDHGPTIADPTLRPNQIFAVGGLPLQLLNGDQARSVVDAVERELLTPMGLRSLGPKEPGYVSRYEGGVTQRDSGYHQGTVWPWLMGPFVEAWVRVRGGSAAVKRQARARFLTPLLRHLRDSGLGHISEIADGDQPHTARGCPFQAWSVGEALRLDRVVLAETPKPKSVNTYEKQRRSKRRETAVI
jgi:predicted glycogen debranching enzyme